jgi:hypothetical protein
MLQDQDQVGTYRTSVPRADSFSPFYLYTFQLLSLPHFPIPLPRPITLKPFTQRPMKNPPTNSPIRHLHPRRPKIKTMLRIPQHHPE